MSPLVLLSKPGCHLCEAMKAALRPVVDELGLELVERDVRDDPEQRRLYALEIPVLLFEGAVVARHRVSSDALRVRLAELASGRS